MAWLPRVASLALLAGLAGAVECAASTTRPTNVIIILADDLGYGDVGIFNPSPSGSLTPRLDRMAQEGARLTRFYAPTPYCAPSRATILTGRYPYHTGMVDNPAPDSGINDIGLPLSEVTLAEMLSDAGYATACIGKWHLGHLPEYFPTRRGFDEYYGILYSNDMRPVQLVENESVAEYPVIQADLTRRYTGHALDFIRRSHGRQRPFFLYLAHAMPHKPLAASEEYWTPETPDDLYADVIRELDANIGRLLDGLRDMNLAENTLVLFLSDNGPWFGGSTGGLRGRKGTTWEGGLRVPFIACQPGRIPAGLVCSEPAGMIDIVPTVLKQLQLQPPAVELDGKDIWPLMTVQGASSPHQALFAMLGHSLRSVTSGPWRLHVEIPERGDIFSFDPARDPRGPDGVTLIAPRNQASAYPGVRSGAPVRPMMLFNLQEDPAEQQDVGAQHPLVLQRLHRLLETEARTAVPLNPLHPHPLQYVEGGNFDYHPRGLIQRHP